MRVCGVELKSNEAIISLLAKQGDLFDIPDCRVRKLTLEQTQSRESLVQFQFAFAKLMEDYKIDKVVIRERPMKGKFAGGAIGFKMEAAIQLCKDLDVTVRSATSIKEIIRENPLPIRFEETELKSFQQAAFMTAYASLC